MTSMRFLGAFDTRRSLVGVKGLLLLVPVITISVACSASLAPSRPSDVPWLPQPSDYGASVDDCGNTVFSSDTVMTPIDVPERRMPGLTHVECWVSHGGENVDEDGAAILESVADRLTGEKVVEDFSCVYVLSDGPWVQGRAPFYGCHGQVMNSALGVAQVVSVYGAIAVTDDEERVLRQERADGGVFDLTGFEVHWLLVTANAQSGLAPDDLEDFRPSPPSNE